PQVADRVVLHIAHVPKGAQRLRRQRVGTEHLQVQVFPPDAHRVPREPVDVECHTVRPRCDWPVVVSTGAPVSKRYMYCSASSPSYARLVTGAKLAQLTTDRAQQVRLAPGDGTRTHPAAARRSRRLRRARSAVWP